ncbi:MAG: 4-phosphoerythronate dehydrogenase [Rhodothermales bacterium]|nr:4-phosphoerythronate dehydrogenase [Rhodothermales bacterium]
MIRIVADADIPNVSSFLADAGHVRLRPGSEINAEEVENADVLLVRSVTRVNSVLLGKSRVRFVGSATAGLDHIDTGYLRDRGIVLRHAPGSNADSVVEYVLAATFALVAGSGLALSERVAGIVGYGNVGSRVARRLRAAGMRVIVNDPPLESSRGAFAPDVEIANLAETVRESDLLTLHVPLEREGEYPTHRLLSDSLLGQMKPGALLINTSRGSVIDESALLSYLRRPDAGPAVLDVWESEPTPNLELVAMSRICTPHIAGYSVDAKLAGSRAIARAVRAFLELPSDIDQEDQRIINVVAPAPSLPREEWFHELTRQMYDIEEESEDFRQRILESEQPSETFTQFRRNYPPRYSFGRYRLTDHDVPTAYRDVYGILGVGVRPPGAQS